MSIFIDSHVHSYPSYRPDVFFGAFRAAVRASGASVGAFVLAQREGQTVFEDWSAGKGLPEGTDVAVREDGALRLAFPDGEPDIIVVAGRQIACAERIEILSIGSTEGLPDGSPIADAIEDALRREALPVLAWGVGKWWFSRAKTIASLLHRFAPDELLLGDSSLRPVFWGEPAAMAEARTLGRRVLHGSDPLPPAFEETRAGQYGDLAGATIDPERPLRAQMLAILRNDELVPTGRRAGLLQFFKRMKG